LSRRRRRGSIGTVHRLCFLEPGHFHATLTLRERHAGVSDEVFVYAEDGPELRAFLALVDAFNTRGERPTAWRAAVRAGPDALGRLLRDRPGDLAVLAGRNDLKAGWMRGLHDAGMAVLADKPWLTGPEGLEDVRHVLRGGPVAMEMMTGRHEVATAIEARLVAEPGIFGGWTDATGGPAIRLESVHHLDKRVNGAPLRRPAWYFDVRAQGDAIADIPTHLVDHVQRLVPGEPLSLVSARRWPTVVPREAFARITGVPEFPLSLSGSVEGGALAYLGCGELLFEAGRVPVRCRVRWDLTEPPGGGDSSLVLLSGGRADVRVEQSARTGWARRLSVEPRSGEALGVEAALRDAVAGWQDEWPGLAVARRQDALDVSIPAALRTPHETQFAHVLDDFVGLVDASVPPSQRAAETLAKYELLARAMSACRTEREAPAFAAD
jgi:predicted dehydrogenase